MKSDWKSYRLKDLGRIVGGATPSTKVPEYYDGSIPWITPKDLSTHKDVRIKHGERSITEKGLASCSAQLLPIGTILFSSRAPIGYVALAECEMCTNQGFKSLVPNEKLDSLFGYYLLSFNKERIETLGSGTTFKEVSGSTMKDVEVRIPPLPIQRKIAAVLGSIDDKIENNRKICANLEAQAQALFKSWFVDFEPFGGKMPKGWKIVSLPDIADYINGLAMQKFRPKGNERSLPVMKIKELRQGFCDGSSEECTANIDSKYIIHDGDVVFSWSGSLLVDFWCGGEAGLNQHLFKVTSEMFEKWFVYSWTDYHLSSFIKIAADKATTMGHITREHLEQAKVCVPANPELNKVGDMIRPMFDKVISLRIESRALAEMRDALLPKLMSGEIDVDKVEV